jgi:hypothetical protein
MRLHAKTDALPRPIGAAVLTHSLVLATILALPASSAAAPPVGGTASLAPGTECLVRARFEPDSAGAKAAVLRVAGDAGPLTASLSGLGVASQVLTNQAANPVPTFRWRKVGRQFERGTALSAGRVRCRGCRVTVTAGPCPRPTPSSGPLRYSLRPGFRCTLRRQ